MKSMYRFVYVLLALMVTYPCIAHDIEYVQNIIQQYAYNAYIPCYVNSESFKNSGYNNCNSAQNGEWNIVNSFIKNNATIIDAGACIGEWSEYVLQHTSGKCKVYAFEPIYDSYQILEQLKHRYAESICCVNSGLSDNNTHEDMYYYPDRLVTGCSTRFHRPVLQQHCVAVRHAEFTTLDMFAQQHNITRVHFLKIDTEGSELQVLKGAKSLIESQAIDIIQFEYGGTYTDAQITLDQVYTYLTEYNYSIFRILPSGLLYIPSWDDSLENFQYSNYLALRNN